MPLYAVTDRGTGVPNTTARAESAELFSTSGRGGKDHYLVESPGFRNIFFKLLILHVGYCTDTPLHLLIIVKLWMQK